MAQLEMKLRILYIEHYILNIKADMQRIKLVLEYDGSGFSGWQIQKGQISVQEELERALFVLFKQHIRVTAAGRTDTGVHARNQVVHCDIPDFDIYKLKRSLNGILCRAIAVKTITTASAGFHARFDATARRYRYTITTDVTALNRFYSWTVHYPLNFTLMQAGAKLVLEYEDFKAFCKVNSVVKHHRCNILSSRWLRTGDVFIYEIKANRFLHGMVRAITGTLIELGRGKITLSDMRRIIESGDRRKVPLSVPAKGLVLEEVSY